LGNSFVLKRCTMTGEKPILVIKFGTDSITLPTGEPDQTILSEIARQVADLHPHYRIILVSSGAVGAGKKYIRDYRKTLTQRKAAAAVGNPILIGLYAHYFSPFGIAIAQSLCERQHFANRHQFLQLKSTYEELWASGIIPIVNENDVVSDRELKFSDNDELATLIATGFGAEALMLCTSVGGLMDDQDTIIKEVANINDVFKWVRTDKSSLGLGGMASKLTFTKLATRMGIKVIIFGMKEANSIPKALQLKTGTVFKAERSTLSARNRWLGSGGLIAGQLRIDDGAVRALQNRRSLLAVGILEVKGEFEAGELVEIFNPNHEMVAVARSRETSHNIITNLKTLNFEVANANDIVLL